MKTSWGKLEMCAGDAGWGSGLACTRGLHLCLHAHHSHPEKEGAGIGHSGAPGKSKQ